MLPVTAARPSWRGHLKLSLVTCPVALYNAITPAGDVHFHLINPDTKHRVKSVVIDDWFFGVSSVSADGFESPVVFPGDAGSF